MSKKQEYNADNINVLEGLSAIRKRPGMYIGDVGERGLHHCVYEVLDNSTDEAVAGYGKVIKLTKLKNGGIRVEDEGRGIPVEKKENGISAATITLTVLHAGGKFDKDTYKTSGGLHGIGIKATNATSKWLKLTICRNGEQWEQEFEKGVPLYEIKQVGLSKKTGTTLEFIPDDSLFDNIIYDSELLKNRLRNSSFLTKNIEFIYIDEATKEKESFLSLNGLEDMISYQIDPDNILTPVMSFSGSDEKRGFLKDKDTGKEEENGILEKFDLEVSFLYEKGYKTTISSYVNKILTPGGGVHEQGVLDALSAGILKKVKEAKVVSKKDKEIISKVNLDDVKEGLVLAISLSVYTDIIFEGQTKDKLSGVHLRAMIRNLSRDKIETYLNANPVITNKIVQKVITSRKARESADRARKTERKQQTEEIGSMLGKLTDCRSNNPEECELFLVEGQSAGGCFSAQTLIKTAFGKDFTIKEIAEKHQNGEEIFIYTYNKNTNKIEIQKIVNAWKTKTTSDLVKVFLDNGEEIICTPDHKFMLRDGSYIEAINLKENTSLMPIYTKISDKKEKGIGLNGYEMIFQNDINKYIYTHFLSDDFNLKYSLEDNKDILGKFVRHHIDYNKRNNNPSNLKRMGWDEHQLLHQEQCLRVFQTPEAKEKVRKTMATKESKEKRSNIVKELWKDETYRNKYKKNHHKKMREEQIKLGINLGFGEYWKNEENKQLKSIQAKQYNIEHPEHIERLSLLAKKQWNNEDLKKWRSQKTKEQMSDPEMIEKKLISETKKRIFNTLELLNKVGLNKFNEERLKNVKKYYLLETLFRKMSSFVEYNHISSLEELENSDFYVYNHKVLKVEKYNDKLDVYDIEVPETHNFALAAGVFVHNSAKQGRDGRYQAILPLKGKPINPLKSVWADVIANEEILSLKTALGCGMGDNIDLSKLRYHKIINQTDADIDGCLRGNTKIKLLDGRIKTIKELAELYPIGGETFEVWSYDLEKNTPVIGTAHSVRITKKVNNLYKIIFEDDSFVECTENHPFLTTKGTYVFAEKLQKGDSIESLYFNLYKEYEYISSKSVKYTPTHRYVYSLIDEISNYVIHHKDENKQNNSIKNLEKLTKKEHSKIHSKTGRINLINYNYSDKHKNDIKNAIKKGKYKYNSFEKYNKSEVHKQKVSERNKESWKNEDYRNYMQLKLREYLVNGGLEILSENTKKQWENKEISFKMQATRMVNVIKECLNKYNCVDKDKYNLEKPKTGVPTWDNMLIKLNLKESEVENFAKTYNHKIKSIEIISTNEEEVYDLSVEKYHNFGIIPDDNNKGIVFVHNSHIQQLLLTIYNTLFKPLLEAGHIYRAVPPLHRVKIGKEPLYLNTDKDKQDYIIKITEEESKKIKSSKKYKELFLLDKEKIEEVELKIKEIESKLLLEYSDKLSIEKNNLLNLKNSFKSIIYFNSELKSALSKYVFNRFKGLGEMNPEQLCETTMDPKTRQLIQLKPDKLYDLSDEINIDDFSEHSVGNILSIIERRREEKQAKREKHPVKDALVDLTIDNIIGLISSEKGKEFRKIYLMRNIIGSDIGD